MAASEAIRTLVDLGLEAEGKGDKSGRPKV
jgi:hypothetical protein